MPKTETPPLYRQVSSCTVPGFVVEKIGDDVVSPLQTPFQIGFVPDFSRVVTSLRNSKSSVPQLFQISPSHNRCFEMRYTPAGYILWRDEYDNMYGALQSKGGNVSKPDVRLEERAPSGFIIWGIQDSDSIRRTILASKMMREKGIATEAIVRLIEPTKLPYKGEVVTVAEYKKRLIQQIWKKNHKKRSRNKDGWLSVTREDIPRLITELNNMTFYITTLGRQVSERFFDLNNISSPEDLQKIMDRVFTFSNAKNKWSKRENVKSQRTYFDSKNTDDIVRYFSQDLPTEVAQNYAKLHNAGLLHLYPHLGNISLTGSIYDVDSVYGEPLGLGDEQITEEKIMKEIQFMMKGKQGFHQADGIINLLRHLENNAVFPERSTVSKDFALTFALAYIKERGWTNTVRSHFNAINEVFYICGVTLFSKDNEQIKEKIKEALGQENFDLLLKNIVLHSYGSLQPLMQKYRFPIVVDIEDLSIPHQNTQEKTIPSNLKEDENRRIEVEDLVCQLLHLHRENLSQYPTKGKDFFSFPKVSKQIIAAHLAMESKDVVDVVQMWIEGDLLEILDTHSPRTVGSFMLALGQLNMEPLFSALETIELTHNDPQFIQKLCRMHELFDILPGLTQFETFLKIYFDHYADSFNVNQEVKYKSALAIFGRGIITTDFQEIFNHEIFLVILNKFTEIHLIALEEAMGCPEFVDPLSNETHVLKLLNLSLTGARVKTGQLSNLAILQKNGHHLYDYQINAYLQYFLSSIDKDDLDDPNLDKIFNEVKLNKNWTILILKDLLASKKHLHPHSIFAETLRECQIDADALAEIMKVAVDVYEGDLMQLDATIKTLLESKKIEGVISETRATELILSCIGFGIDIPEILLPCLTLDQNKERFMRFLSKKEASREMGEFNTCDSYTIEPIRALLSQGVTALPASIQDLFIQCDENREVINSLASGILHHLFCDEYLRFFFGGLVNLRNYPKPPIILKDLMVKNDFGKITFQMWKIVHPDIWSIIRLADINLLKDFFEQMIPENKILIEQSIYDNDGKVHLYGQMKVKVASCLPPDIYEKLKNHLPN